MPSSELRLFFLAVATLAVSCWDIASAQPTQPDASFRSELPLKGAPRWIASGAWSADGSEILLVDQYREEILQLSPLGLPIAVKRELGTAVYSASPPCKVVLPWQVRRIDDGYLLEDEKRSREEVDEILHLNEDLECIDSIKIKGRKIGSDGTELQVVYDWTPMGEGILAFADLFGPSGWESAFLYFDKDGESQIFSRLESRAQVRNHYARSEPYLTSIDGVGYILFLDEMPKMVEVRLGVEGVRELPSFPKEFQFRPSLINDQLPRQPVTRKQTKIYQIYEDSKMAVSLHSWGGSLYLLAKDRKAPNGETAWWLIKIDLDRGSKCEGGESARYRLPTGAAHLTVIPGDRWVLVERGAVAGYGELSVPLMDTESMVVMPSAWFESSEKQCSDQNR